MILKEISTKVIIFGCIVSIVLIVLVGATSVRMIETLSDLTIKMHRHPFVVSNAVMEIDSKIVSMHRYMKDVVLAKTNVQIIESASYVDQNEKQVFELFDILKERFLGHPEQVDDLYDTFKDWKIIRSEVINLMLEGKRDEAASITKAKGAEHVSRLDKKMDALIVFARNKANEFATLSDTAHVQKEKAIILLTLCSIFFLSAYTVMLLRMAHSNNIAIAEREARVQHLHKMEALGTMAAGVAHEINNPINGVINYAQLLKNKKDNDDYDLKLINGISKEGERVAKIVKTLLAHSHKAEDELKPINLDSVVTNLLTLSQKQIENDGIFLTYDKPEKIPQVNGAEHQLEQVLFNLINNSRYALNQGLNKLNTDKVLKIFYKQYSEEESDYLSLNVWDNGSGIEKEAIDKVVTPFYTTKPAGAGTGLGLNICHEIIKKHGGELRIDSEVGVYTQISFSIPLA